MSIISKKELEHELTELGYSNKEARETDNLLKEGKLPDYVTENIGFIINTDESVPEGYYPKIPKAFDILSDLLENPDYLCGEVLAYVMERGYKISLNNYAADTPASQIVAGILLSTTEKRLSEGKFRISSPRILI